MYFTFIIKEKVDAKEAKGASTIPEISSDAVHGGTHAYIPGLRRLSRRMPEIQVQPGLHSQFKASLHYTGSLCL